MQLIKLSLIWALTCLALAEKEPCANCETDATTGMELLQLKNQIEELTETDGALDEEDDDEEEDEDEAEVEEAESTPDTPYVPKTVCGAKSEATSGGWWCPEIITEDWKFPQIPKTVKVKVTYAEAPITAFEKATENMPVKTNPLLHAGLIFDIPSFAGKKSYFKARKIVLEMTAKMGMTNALLPSGVGAQGPIWNNEAVINFMDYSNETYWKKQTSIGEVKGAHVRKLMKWIRKKYIKSGVGGKFQYETFNVWKAPAGKIDGAYVAPKSDFFLEDRVCDAFAESAIRYLIKKGLKKPENAFRNYFVFVTSKEPQQMDPSKPEDLQTLGKFYGLVQAAAQAAQAKSLDAVSAVVQAAKDNGAVAVAYNPSQGGYFKVELVPPFILNQYGKMRF